MAPKRTALTGACLGGLLHLVSAQTWCGKNYKSNEPVVAPGGQFQFPPTSAAPLLAFQCTQAIKPYLAEDASGAASMLIDTAVTTASIPGAAPIALPAGWSISTESLAVTISVDGRTLAQGSVPLNASGYALPFPLSGLQPQMEAHNVSCAGSYTPSAAAPPHSSAALRALQPPALPAWADLFAFFAPRSPPATPKPSAHTRRWHRPADGSAGPYAPVFALGFYTAFDGYLAANLSVLDELKAQGFTIVHPIPPFDDAAGLEAILDRMQEVGLYLTYDMRLCVPSLPIFASPLTPTQRLHERDQVNAIKSRPNLLLWYTADEPDGPPTRSPPRRRVRPHLRARRVPPRLPRAQPRGLPLRGADVLLQDPYMVGNDVSFSNTDAALGCCGCDNCLGTFADISGRVDAFRARLRAMGRGRGAGAFGGAEYWTRAPTGAEWAVQTVLAINHGATGIVPWTDPAPADIKAAASASARSYRSSRGTRTRASQGRLWGAWTWACARTLVLAANAACDGATLDLRGGGGGGGAGVWSGAAVEGALVAFGSLWSISFATSAMNFVFSFSPTSTPGFVVSSGGSTSWLGIPEDLKAKITEVHGRDESLLAVSVAPDGDWFLKTDRCIYHKVGPPSRIQDFIQFFAEKIALPLLSIEAFTFGPNPGTCVLTASRQGGEALCWSRSEAGPNSLDAQLLAALETTEVRSVAMSQEGWVLVGVDGSVKWSGIPDSMVTTIRSRASIPIRSVHLSLADSDHWLISYADYTVSHSLPKEWASAVDEKARICLQVQQRKQVLMRQNEAAQSVWGTQMIALMNMQGAWNAAAALRGY
ncbi:hypothetical protein HWV62_12064 [Athelia sp. TMB]|nr:hypothetical protein HWV62_12064 [Athelia sp. TMB]